MPTESQVYLSTRGGSTSFSFRAVVLKGLAADGGLFIPHAIPTIPSETLESWQNLSFQELALRILELYISKDEIPSEDLADLVTRSYSTFRSDEVTPLVELIPDEKLYLLELFHGPTYAFKDVALQFLGNLFEYFLQKENEGKVGKERNHLTVLGATSGDTGSAAIYGLRGKKDVDVFILHPHKRISPIQEAQMTTVLDPNVHNLAVNGTFDDCQDIVKAIFSDDTFNKKYHLGAVNSINWARILAQITYYFHSYFNLLRRTRANPADINVQFVVPTGNFGDILAGYYAKKMGLPIAKLVVATNANDILDRFFRTGRYEKKPVHGSEAEGGEVFDGVKAHEDGAKETLSPAMDILVSSNFERLLWYLARENETGDVGEDEKSAKAGRVLKGWMDGVKSKGGIAVSKAVLHAAQRDFTSFRVSDQETLGTIAEIYKGSKYVLDPHTAVGVHAATKLIREGKPADTYTISLSTAHPCKFSKAVNDALEKMEGYCWDDIIPEDVRDLLVGKEQRVLYISQADAEAVKKAIVEHVS